ncbi:S8 family serine peptidase [Mesobacillus sp.]|uniref:S8 family serine peptidase n=1 Tax=Mesobacillus sp. TaxID=2675271 RepID=UPI0039EF6DEE
MLKKHSIRSTAILLIFILAFSTFGMGAFANGTSGSASTSVTPQQLAELYGKIDVKSSKPTTVIVELNEKSIVEAKHSGTSQSKAKLKAARDKVKDSVKKAAKSSKIQREYDYVFSGFSVELTANQIPALLAVPGVKAVYPDVTYSVTGDEGTLITAEAFSPEMMNSAPYIGANAAWDSGYTGEGVTVAVIDTGADYTHPDLAHAFGDYKGWDFVDNDNDPQETPAGDPRGEETTHGTHVSGTVAANGQIKGVAPNAKLLAYRVLGPGGSGTTENVIAGIERAVQDGADIMNLSLGNPLNLPDYATSIALDWAMAEGVIAVTSNGNSGPANWTVGSPGTSRDAISVGATQLPFEVYNVETTTTGGVTYDTDKVMGYADVADLKALDEKEFEYVFAGLGSPEEFENIDVEGKIALISRGTYAFVDKAAAAKAAGAVGAIIFNSGDGEIPYVIPGMEVPTIKMSKADGQKMLAELEKGNNTVSFNLDYVKTDPEIIAEFSSRGPVTETWMIKPDVSAPGVNIVSTVPGGYGSKQGTSMASPHVAGAAALLLQAHPDWNVHDVKAALMNTAENLEDPATGEDYPHNTQGAGSIRVVEAINAKTLVTPGSHSFGVFLKNKGKQVEKQHFTLKNLSNERKIYSFDVSFEGNPDGLKVMTSKNLKVNAGKSQQVNLNVQVDAGKLAPGYYEGTIVVSDGTASFDVPTILFVQEPDYPRVEYVDVMFDSNGITEVGGYFTGGAESVDFFVYLSDVDGNPLQYLGDIGYYESIPVGFHSFEWDGTLMNGFKLPKGYYYNVYAYATYKGISSLEGVNFLYE